MTDGFPVSRFYRKTNNILLWEGETPSLFAATDGGFFKCDLKSEKWRQHTLGGKRERAIKLLIVKDKLIVFTPSHAYASPFPSNDFKFKRLMLQREEPDQQVSLIKLFFDLHGGTIWGLPGRLLYDVVGLIIIFLSVSAFYIWYFPRKKRRERKNHKNTSVKFNKVMFKYHFKLGIWVAFIMLIIAGTGLFKRPPMLALLASGSISRTWYPGSLPSNPWDEKIHNALYDAVEKRIIIEATDGFWTGSTDFSTPFLRKELPVPVFVMGATVFEPYGSGGFLVGSFSGIFHLERATGKAFDILTNKEVSKSSAVRPAEIMVSGYFKTPDGRKFITTHKQGLLPLNGNAALGDFPMPERIIKNYRMPLWNYLFEIHNGRFFKDWIGGLYILLLPLGSLLFIIITLTGVYDWLFTRLRKKIK